MRKLTKAKAYDVILSVAQECTTDTQLSKEQQLSKLMGTIFGCAAVIEPDSEEDDRK